MTLPPKNDSSSLDDLSMFQEGDAEFDAETEDEDYGQAEDNGDWDDSYDEAPDEELIDTERSTGQRQRRSQRSTQQAAVSTGGMAKAIGIVSLLLGAACGALAFIEVPALTAVIETLSKLGVSPALLLVSGIILLAIGSSTKAASKPAVDSALHERIDANIECLMNVKPSGAESENSAAAEDRNHILAALQRQDEKVTNLTRATKMYGKPLVEISTQVNDLGSKLADLATQVATLSEKPGTDTTARTHKAIEGLTQDIEKLVTNDDLLAGLEMLASKAPSEAPNEDLEQTLSSIQREIQGLATSVSQIQSAPAPAPQSAPQTVSPQASQQANPAPTPQTMPAQSEGKAPPAGLATSIAGARKTGSKNVLGAIAKLKGMRN